MPTDYSLRVHRVTVERAIGAAYRLALLYTGLAEPNEVYSGSVQPQHDEHYLLELIEGARDVWRTIRRRRSDGPLEP